MKRGVHESLAIRAESRIKRDIAVFLRQIVLANATWVCQGIFFGLIYHKLNADLKNIRMSRWFLKRCFSAALVVKG